MQIVCELAVGRANLDHDLLSLLNSSRLFHTV